MNANINPINDRLIKRLVLVAVLILIGAQSSQSQIAIRPKVNAVAPRVVGGQPAPVNAAPTAPVLKWNNGESIEGEIVGATTSELSWKTPAFSDPLLLGLSYLHSMEFPQQDKEPGEPFMVTMRNGDRLYGKLAALDEKSITISSDCHGESVLLHSEVASLRRMSGKSLLYSGPAPGAPWRAINDRYNGSTNKRPLWKSAEGGRPVLGTWNGINFLPLALPGMVEVAFHLRSTALPQFRAYLNSNFGASPSIETWDDLLVLVHDGHYALLRKMDPGEREVNLRICWNQKEKRCAVFTMEGEMIAELVTKEAAASEKPSTTPMDGDDPFADRRGMVRPQGKPESGFCLHNTGINLMLETLHVKEWNGQPPPKLKLDQSRLEFAAGGVAVGKVVQATAETVIVQSPDGSQKNFPLESVEAVVLASEPVQSRRAGTELLFADGAFISGKLLEIKNGVASIQSSFSANPIQSKIASLKQVRLRVPKAAGDSPVEPSLTELDQLVMGKNSLHGVPVGSGDALLRWMPVGGVRPVPLAGGTEVEMICGTKPGSPVKKADSLFFLTNGDILPGEFIGMDETFVDLHTAISAVKRLPSVNLQAIQFSGPEYNPDGFKDPGWREVKGGANSVILKDNAVTIKGGGAFGHPSVLQADELKFNFQAKDGYGAMRVRFFVNDIKSAAKSISLLLMTSGNEIYCGQETADGQFQQRAQFVLTSSKPAQIKIALNENNIEIFINDVSIHKMPAVPARREGLGLVFEAADVWGNGERDITLSNFTANINLERGWFPAIEAEARAKALLVPRFRREDLPSHILVAANGDLLRGHIEAVSSNQIRVRSGLETVNIPRNRVSAAIWLLPPNKDATDQIVPKKEEEKTAANQPGQRGGGMVIGGGGVVRIQVNGGGVLNLNGAVQGGGLEIEEGDIIPGPDGNVAPGNAAPAVAGSNDKTTAGNSAETSSGFTPTHWFQLRDGGRIALDVERFDSDRLTGHSPLFGTCVIPLDRIHIMRFKNPGLTPAMVAYRGWRLQHAPEPVLPETGGQSSPTLGKEIKDFRLPLLGGGDFIYGNEKGKVIVLDFWATWCGPCVQSLPGLIEAMKPLDAKRVKFIGVNQGEEAAQVKRFLEQRGWKFTVALDATQSVAQQFGVTGIPHTVIIGPDGKVAWVNTGYRPGAEKDAVTAVNKLLEAAPPK